GAPDDMNALWSAIQKGYLSLIEPVADFLVRRRVSPNVITTFGTFCTVVAGVLFATGHIRSGGWFLGITALFDVLDGTVARRTGTSTLFGAFYDSTLDRFSDGALLGGFVVFYATSKVHESDLMLTVTLLGLIATFVTSYTRSRAEALGLDAKVGLLQRPERVTLLAAPQAFFGLAFGGWVLAGIIILLSVTAWITVVQRILYVYRTTQGLDGNSKPINPSAGAGAPPVPPAAPPLSNVIEPPTEVPVRS
ncbi:MAG: CDP-alcohol phosphatidyltransferase family protein, partial [Gemmatimonadaceae bacterium]